MANKNFPLLVIVALVVGLPEPAWAYIGPGSGLSAVGAAFALVASVAVALIGFVWYPLKRIVRRLSGSKRGPAIEQS